MVLYMKNNFLHLPVIEYFLIFLISIAVTFIFLLLVTIYVGAKERKTKVPYSQDNSTFAALIMILSIIAGIVCAGIILGAADNEDFSKIYNVKLVEKEAISEIDFSKKDEFKQRIFNKLYTDNGHIYIIKDPKSNNYFLSSNKKTLEDILRGKTSYFNANYETYSKEDIRKTLENKVSEDKTQGTVPSNVKESDFK